MSDPDQDVVTSEDLHALAKVARIELAAGRHEIVAPALSGVLALFDALDAVELGETPPTNAYDARWRNL